MQQISIGKAAGLCSAGYSAILYGKKLERVPIACSGELKSVIGRMSRLRQIPVSELCHRYIIDGLARDIGEAVLAGGVRPDDLVM